MTESLLRPEKMMEGKENYKPNNYLRMHSSLSAFCHSMFMMAKFLSFRVFGLFHIERTAQHFPSRHNHISVICDWWLDIKNSGGRKKSKKNLFFCFFQEGLESIKGKSVLVSRKSKIYFEVSPSYFISRGGKCQRREASEWNFYFYRIASSGLWTKNIVPFPWFSWRALFREAFTGTERNKKFICFRHDHAIRFYPENHSGLGSAVFFCLKWVSKKV